MRRRTPFSRWLRTLFISIATCATLAAALATRTPARGSTPPADHGHMAMSEAETNEKIRAWFAVHPETPSAIALQDEPADTFMSGDFYFDSDGNLATLSDTAFIQPGQSVLWQWVDGSHTTTNGTDPEDTTAATIWNHAINTIARQFVQIFPDEGTFPFYCVPHFTNMTGVVVVQQTVGVRPMPAMPTRIGFLIPPTPNPSPGRVLFQFGLRETGHVRVEVVDARGRLVAVPVDENLGDGGYSGLWDGKTTAGARVARGVYYLRLTVPGARETKSVVLTP